MKTYIDHQKEQMIEKVNLLLPLFSLEFLDGLQDELRKSLGEWGLVRETGDAPQLRLVKGGKRGAACSASAKG